MARARVYQEDGAPHEGFALWMTAEPAADRVPHTLVTSCVKVAYEAPHGVKRNMRRAYDTWANTDRQSSVMRGGGSPEETTRSVYALAWFHSIVLERRTYIPQGWSQYYEFNDSDLSVALRVLQKAARESYRRPGTGGL